MTLETLPIVVIGAGPVGLSAAVRLLERGLEPLILEAASDVAASPRDWGHVRLFSPWRHDWDRAAVELLDSAGWTAPAPDDLPTGQELYRRYLRRGGPTCLFWSGPRPPAASPRSIWLGP